MVIRKFGEERERVNRQCNAEGNGENLQLNSSVKDRTFYQSGISIFRPLWPSSLLCKFTYSAKIYWHVQYSESFARSVRGSKVNDIQSLFSKELEVLQ